MQPSKTRYSFNRTRKFANYHGLKLTRIKPEPYVSLQAMDRYLLQTEDLEYLGSFKTLKQVIRFITRYNG